MMIFLLSIFVIFILVRWILYHIRQFRYIDKFAQYSSVLDIICDKAYNMIYKDKLMIFSIEATKVDDKEFNEYAKEFGGLVIKLMGPALYKEYTNFFGNKETFFLNLIEYFNTKYESDEIREAAIDNLTNEDQLA